MLEPKYNRVVLLAEKALRLLFEIMLIIAIIFLLYVNVSQYLLGQTVLAVVKGTSMEPLLRDQNVVILTSPTGIRLGDVIVFRNDYGELVVHRVIAIVYCDDGRVLYVTKGDNNVRADVYIPGIAGKTAATCRARYVDVLPGYRNHVVVTPEGLVKGIAPDRIIGKVLEVGSLPIKIVGLSVFASSR